MPEVSTAGAQPGNSPPFGGSPAVGATPNRGFEAQGMQRLGAVIKQLEQLIPLLGISSEAGKDVMKALNSLSKHVPDGSVTPAGEKNALESAQMKNMQNAQMQAQLRAAQQQQGQGAQQGAQPPKGLAA